MAIKVGDSVKVKKGVLDPDDNKTDISGWQGRVIKLQESENAIEIAWDSITLLNIPKTSIQDCETDGFDWSCMWLDEKEVEISTERDTLQDVAKTIDEINEEIEPYEVPLDEMEEYVAEIIDDEDLSINEDTLELYLDHLEEYVTKGYVLTGREMFDWEEKYIMGAGSQTEYANLKKTQASYNDTFVVRDFEIEDELLEIMANITRKTDKKKFTIPLSYLKSVEEGTEADFALDAYSSWIVNYS